MDRNIPKCLGPVTIPSALEFVPPKGACDAHFHIFGPTSKFPYASNRRYTPPAAPFEDFTALLDALQLDRAVCVHPNLHGDDNSVTLDTVVRGEGRFVGVIKPNAEMTLADFRDMDRKGICGARFAFNPQHGGSFDDVLFEKVANWCQELGWFVELHMAPEELQHMADLFHSAKFTIVIDHMGRIDVRRGLEQAPFVVLLDLIKQGNIWVKLSGADRISYQGYPYEDVVPFARALIDTAADRVVWGTDWPHSAYFDSQKVPDDGHLLNFLLEVAPDEQIRNQILVSNPARLFGL